MTIGDHGPWTESGNVAAVRRFVDAFNRRDVSRCSATRIPTSSSTSGRRRPALGPTTARTECAEALDAWFETWEWMHVEIEELRRGRATACSSTLHQRAKGSSSGIEVEIKSWNVYTFGDGKVTRIQLFTRSRRRRSRRPDSTPNYEEEKR